MLVGAGVAALALAMLVLPVRVDHELRDGSQVVHVYYSLVGIHLSGLTIALMSGVALLAGWAAYALRLRRLRSGRGQD